MDSRIIINEIRTALDEKAARDAGRQVGEPEPLFVELEGYVREIFPSVQAIYDRLATVQRVWYSNGVDAILDATKDGEIPLAQGTLTAGQLKDLQRVFRSLKVWIEEPIVLPEDPDGTPEGPIPLVVISQRPKVLPAQAARL